MDGVTTLKTKIHDDVLDRIINGEYELRGVFTERSLIEEYGASKSPVREALIELCNEGILRSMPRYGYEVVRVSTQDIIDIREQRIMLECGCMRRYWLNYREEANLKQITEHVNRYTSNIYDRQEALDRWKRNTRFHLLLASFSGNQFVYDSLERALRHLSVAYAQLFWNKWSQTGSHHHKIYDCILSNNCEEAQRYLELDISGYDDDLNRNASN